MKAEQVGALFIIENEGGKVALNQTELMNLKAKLSGSGMVGCMTDEELEVPPNGFCQSPMTKAGDVVYMNTQQMMEWAYKNLVILEAVNVVIEEIDGGLQLTNEITGKVMYPIINGHLETEKAVVEFKRISPSLVRHKIVEAK